MDNPHLTVGIIGGMGPEATADLLHRIVANTPARDDRDHIRVLVDNNPQVPSRIAALIDGDGPSPAPTLVAMAQQLQAWGAQLLAMPCNTAHHYYPDIAAAVDIPVINMVEESLAWINAEQGTGQRVGLLASSALQKIGLYDRVAEHAGMSLCYPNEADQRDVMTLITAIKAAAHRREQVEALAGIVEGLREKGAGNLLIACTELSVIADDIEATLPVFDASEILARAIVRSACSSQSET